MCKKQMVSIYPADAGFPVYCGHCWWSDKHDARKFGLDFDFNKSFFEQFAVLQKTVPRINLHTQEQNNVNSEYTNHSDWNKNSYMCVNSAHLEDCYYCTNFNIYNKDCVDCLGIQKCELCYDCIDTRNSYSSINLKDCESCTECAFLYNCIGCENCFMSYNLRHKKYYIRNQQATREEYEKMRKSLSNALNFEQTQKEFAKYMISAPRKYCTLINCENVTGDHVEHSQNVQHGFYGFKCKDVKFAYDFGEMKDCYDIYEPWQGELQYETHGVNESYNIKFTHVAWRNNDLTYCDICFNAQYLFGCIGIHNQKYCILNKQYEKEEWLALVPRIIEHMRKTKEYGEFFPMSLALFPYNESVAQEYYPLTREEALKKGFKWKEPDIREYQKQTYAMPEDISRVPDSAANELLACGSCGKNYKIIAQELAFYKKMRLPIPKKCFNCRHLARMSLRNPRKLWPRKCEKCGVGVSSSYPPDRPEKVYCEKCFVEFLD